MSQTAKASDGFLGFTVMLKSRPPPDIPVGMNSVATFSATNSRASLRNFANLAQGLTLLIGPCAGKA
jgi:hypothetical protein